MTPLQGPLRLGLAGGPTEMHNEGMMKAAIACAALFGLVAASEPEFRVAADDACRQQCQSVENQCRMASKDLDSSKCTAKFLACIASCSKARR